MSTEEILRIVVEEHDPSGSSQVIGTAEPSHQVPNSVPESEYLAPSSYIYDQVHAALEEEIKRKDAAGASRSLIWKVPAKYRNSNAEHYKPVSWRFGLHNCPDDSLLNSVTEGFKIKVAGALQLSGKLWNQFCEEVVKEPKEHWDAVYDGSLHARSYSIEEIRCLLSLDALFLVVFLQTYALENEPAPVIQEEPAHGCLWFPMEKKRSSRGKCPTLGIEEETIRVSQAVDLVMKNPVLEIYKDTLWHDIWLVGNQIPIELLQRVVGILTPRKCDESWGDVVKPAWEPDDWQARNILHCVPWNFFYGPSIDTTQKDNLLQKRMEEALRHPDSCHGIHILDSVYSILGGHKSRFGSHFYYFQNVRSAAHLEACGVTIRGKEFTCFEDISFENGVLKVPFLRIQHGTEKFLRNLIVHERLTVEKGKPKTTANFDTEPEKTATSTTTTTTTTANPTESEALTGWTRLKSPIFRAFRRESKVAALMSLQSTRKGLRRPTIRNFSVNCYTNFMESLMKTPQDVDLLVKRGVLSVHIGSHAMVVDMFKRINCNIPEPRVTAQFLSMLRSVNTYSKQRRNQLWSEFKREYCNPWIVLSVLALTFVTIATGIQTYTAVTGSDGMKPGFSTQP